MTVQAYTQSSAVLRFVARKGGLYPEDAELAYEVDNMIAAVDDYRSAGAREQMELYLMHRCDLCAAYGVIFSATPEKIEVWSPQHSDSRIYGVCGTMLCMPMNVQAHSCLLAGSQADTSKALW